MRGSSPQIRRRARERAVQFLYGLDFTRYHWRDRLDDFWQDNPSREPVKKYAAHLIKGVTENREELDAAISGALDRWDPKRVGHIEQNILRIGLYEMRYTDDVPETVAITEAIEVARRFGAEEAPRFVNAILDRLKGERDHG